MYLNKLRLDGRVAVVTGGGRAIGLACVQALAEAGADVVIADADAEVAAVGQAEVVKSGLRAAVISLDVTKPAMVTAAADKLVSEQGRVDILVNNAGIARGVSVLFASVSAAAWVISNTKEKRL